MTTSPSGPKVVSLANNKGGTGKTATTVNLAASLAEKGYHLLVVDLDPQGNTGRRLAWTADPTNPQATVSDVLRTLAEDTSGSLVGLAADAYTGIGWPEPYSDRITLLPSRSDLENRATTEAGVLGAVQRLATALEGAISDFDIVLIDCPPNLGHITQMALAASDFTICVMDPEIDGIEGALALRDFVANNRRKLGNPKLEVGGYIVNRVDTRTGAHRFAVEVSIPEAFGEDLWGPAIPERVAVKDAADADPPRPLRALGRDGEEMAKRYDEIADRVVARLGLPEPTAVN